MHRINHLPSSFSVLIFLVLLFSIVFSGKSQGQFHQSLTLSSSVLNRDVKYSIYLPPDYFSSKKEYPVIYLLHGYGYDESSWSLLGKIDKTLEYLIANEHMTEMVLVMPDGQKT